MPEIKQPNKFLKEELGYKDSGIELKEDRVKVQSPSLYKEVFNKIERIEKHGKRNV